MNKANKKISVSELIEANKTLRKSKTPAELLVRSLTLLYTKAEKLAANVFAEFGITIAQYNILALLAEEDNKINQLTISKRMLVSPGNITRILDKLVAAQLIQRTEDKQDRRHKCISITQKGKALHHKIKPVYDSYLQRLPAALSAKEQQQTAYTIIEWAHSLDSFSL